MIDPQPIHPFAWTPQPWGRALQSSVFARVAPHLFTTRDLPLRGPGEKNGWARLAASAGVGPDRLIRLKQVHGVEVVVIHATESRRKAGNIGAPKPIGFPPSESGHGRPRADIDPPITPITAIGGGDGRMPDDAWPRADIVMTDDPTVAVAVQVADCVPLLLADPVTGAVAAVHGGWRGTAAGIARVAVAAVSGRFGARPADLLAAIGPSIGACCYQVGPDVLGAFRAAGFSDDNLRSWFRPDEPIVEDKKAIVAQGAEPIVAQSFSRVNARYRLDVPKAIVDQLLAAGLAPANIAACGLCTACNPSLFPSYRRDGVGTGRIAGVIRPGCDGRWR